MKAIEKALDNDDATQAKVRRELGELLVKGDDHSLILLQTNHDASQVFTNYIRKGVVEEGSAKLLQIITWLKLPVAASSL